MPDDASSVHGSSAIGGVGVGVVGHAAYPPMFSNFQNTWPTLNDNARTANGVPRPNGGVAGKIRATESVAGESTAPTESDVTGAVPSTLGGVDLKGLSINDARAPSLNQSDRLAHFAEGNGSMYTGSATSSQVGGGGYD